jgi:hypothetical protein
MFLIGVYFSISPFGDFDFIAVPLFIVWFLLWCGFPVIAACGLCGLILSTIALFLNWKTGLPMWARLLPPLAGLLLTLFGVGMFAGQYFL